MSAKSPFDELSNNSNTAGEVVEDFLEVDKPVPGQNFVCLSFISPEKLLTKKEDYYFHEFNKKRFQTFQKEQNAKLDALIAEALEGKVDVSKLTEFQKDFVKATDDQVKQQFESFAEDLKDFHYANEDAIEEKFHEDNNLQTSIRSVKVRGVYNTIKEANIRAKVLQRMDPTFNIFVGQVGYWLPWDPTADKVENQEYQNAQLNDIVRKYKTNESKRDEFYEQQKIDRKKEALKKVQESKAAINESSVGLGSAAEPTEPTGISEIVESSNLSEKLTDTDPWLARKMKEAATTTEDAVDEQE
jgi:hypothetical protein